MQKEKKEIWLLVALLLILAVFIFRMMGEIRQRPSPPSPPPVAETAVGATVRPRIPDTGPAENDPPAEEAARRELSARARAELPWSRDPFLPPDRPDADQPTDGLRLLGVVGYPENPLATIGGNFYREGDTVEGFTVRAITRDSVILLKDGEEVTLKIAD